MENKKFKLIFKKEGNKDIVKEITISKINTEHDMQTSLDLLGIQAKAEQRYKDIKTDEKNEEEYTHYRNLIAMQFNLDVVYYTLHKIDEKITFEMVSSLGKQIPEVVNYLFEKKDDKDFQKATNQKMKVANLPQEKQ